LPTPDIGNIIGNILLRLGEQHNDKHRNGTLTSIISSCTISSCTAMHGCRCKTAHI